VIFGELDIDILWPFDKPTSDRIAVKVINHLGVEVIAFIKISSVSCLATNHRVSEVPRPSDEEGTQRAGSVRSMTGLPEPAFEARLVPFEHAFGAYMQDPTMAGQPRTVRRDRTDATCPLPTMADKLLLRLTYVKQHPMPAVQGQLCGRSQSKAHKWLHLLHAMLNQA
jgi:hypothetical protein